MASERDPGATAAAAWLVSHAALLPARGAALDVACGRGRNTFWLAARGLDVLALDRDADAVRVVDEEATRRGLRVRAEVRDLEGPEASIPAAAFDVVVVVHYLHRPLFPQLVAALRPGGLLVYETFTRAQAEWGRPINPAFLLDSGELLDLAAGLDVLAHREGDYDGRSIASVVARKRGTGE